MTLYDDVFSEVVAATGRPDLITETSAAIRRATLKLHLAELWPRDLIELSGVSLTPLASPNKYALDIKAAPLVRFRQLEYLRLPATAAYGIIDFDIVEAISILDGYGRERPRYCYAAGANYIVRSDLALSTVDIGYYQRPDLAVETYDSWIAESYINAISDEAASYVFKAIGKDDEFNRFAAAYKENLLLLQAMAIV